jgi:branched-subunit amino acid aminotransferase/4-amino-4-deoxychorismate lyase
VSKPKEAPPCNQLDNKTYAVSALNAEKWYKLMDTPQHYYWKQDTFLTVQDNAPLPIANWYGLSVYTSFLANATTIALHLQRLNHNATVLGLQPLDKASTQAVITTLWRNYYKPYPLNTVLRVRLSLVSTQNATLGAGITPLPANQHQPSQLLLSLTPHQPLSNPMVTQLYSVPYQRPYPHCKHGGITETLLYRRQHTVSTIPWDQQDVLWVNPLGYVTEASFSNIFGFTHTGGLWTPDCNQAGGGCLPGITRQQLLETAKQLGLLVDTTPKTITECQTSLAGLFLTNAIGGLRPVQQLNGLDVVWTAQALTCYEALVRHYSGVYYG